MFKTIFKGYEAIIFDLDGTIVQDEPTWNLAKQNIFEPEIVSQNPYYGERGLQLRENISLIVKNNYLRSNVNQQTYYQLVVKEFFNNFDDVYLTEGFIEFAENLKKLNIRMVLVTNTDRDITLEIIERLKIEKYFEFVVTPQDVKNPKPFPDIYEFAINKLKVAKNKILVFEDSPAGNYSAEMAGLQNRIIVLDPSLDLVSFGSTTRNFIDDFEIINDNIKVDADDYIMDLFQ